MTVDVLGTTYSIIKKKYDEEPLLKEISGWCSTTKPEIIVGDLTTFPEFQKEEAEDIELLEKRILRHEIVHAFLNESGLGDNSFETECWAQNEEMVDWIALQGEKIYMAWKRVNAL